MENSSESDFSESVVDQAIEHSVIGEESSTSFSQYEPASCSTPQSQSTIANINKALKDQRSQLQPQASQLVQNIQIQKPSSLYKRHCDALQSDYLPSSKRFIHKLFQDISPVEELQNTVLTNKRFCCMEKDESLLEKKASLHDLCSDANHAENHLNIEESLLEKTFDEDSSANVFSDDDTTLLDSPTWENKITLPNSKLANPLIGFDTDGVLSSKTSGTDQTVFIAIYDNKNSPAKQHDEFVPRHVSLSKYREKHVNVKKKVFPSWLESARLSCSPSDIKSLYDIEDMSQKYLTDLSEANYEEILKLAFSSSNMLVINEPDYYDRICDKTDGGIMCTLSDILNFSEEDGLLTLRYLELEAYVGIVSAFRAQGSLVEEKKNILKLLQQILGISVERHKAEIRRAVNDEKLSTICLLQNGTLCETSWQKEGRRLMNVLKRAAPQTAFTEIANKISKITAKENDEVRKFSLEEQRRSNNKHATSISSDTIITTNIPTKELMTADASTSTDDLLGDVEQTDSTLSKPSGSFVYLPYGTIVHMEKNFDKRPQKKFENSQINPTMYANSPNFDRKSLMNNVKTEDTPFVIKEVYRPSDVQAIQQSKLLINNKQTVTKDHSVSALVESENIAENQSDVVTQYPLTKHAQDVVQETEFSTRHTSSTNLYQLKTSLVRDHTDQYSVCEKVGSIIPQAPVPPEHLYAVGASRTKATARTNAASWATKNNTTTNATKVKKRFHKPPMQYVQKKGNSSACSRLNWFSSSISFGHEKEKSMAGSNKLELKTNSSSKVLSLKVGNESLSNTSLHISDSLFSTNKDNPPQKVFRPSIGMSGFSLKTHKSLTTGLNTETQQNLCSSVETGLASVSSIVSRVSSPAEPLIEHVSGVNIMEQQFPHSPSLGSTMSKSLPTETLFKMCRERELVSKTGDNVTFEIKSLPNSSLSSNSNLNPWKSDSSRNMTSSSIGNEKSRNLDIVQSNTGKSVNLAVSGLCALAAAPIIGNGCDSKTSQNLYKEKYISEPKPHPFAGSGIIKVASRPMQSKVAQVQSLGNSKPSIIVVHRHPGGKPSQSTPAKFLEMSNKAVTKPLSKVSVPISGTTTLVKPVPTKVVSVTTNVRTVAGKPVVTTNFHKVITKGKMQQLVLKPTIPIAAPSQRQVVATKKSVLGEGKPTLDVLDDKISSSKSENFEVPSLVSSVSSSQLAGRNCLVAPALKSVFKPRPNVTPSGTKIVTKKQGDEESEQSFHAPQEH